MSRQFSDVHADWLRLVEPEGQFLTLPVVRRAFPSGLDSTKTSVRDALRKHYPNLAVPKRSLKDAAPTQEQWDRWIDWLLRDALEWGPFYRAGENVDPYTCTIPEYGITLNANAALIKDDKARVLLMRYPHRTPLDERTKGDRWNTSPIDRIKELCKSQNVRLGLVTDGERIVLVWVPNVGAGGHATWDTSLFLESRERGMLQSFTSLLRASRFFAVQEDAQIEALFEASEKFQNEVTSQLGFQVRQAVELLVNAISKANLERGGKLLTGIPPQRVYEAAATVMMRLVFLLYAEERDLLPLSEPLYADFYAASTLREQLDEQAAIEGDEPLERRGAAWNRLLATFRVIYAGLNHDRLRLPPYGGRLFDPDRFPFLEGRTEKQKWNDAASAPLFVDDLTVRAILEAIQTLPIRENGSNERRKLSFRALDVEQIGHVYEGLLDHGAERVDEVYVGLVGKTGDEAEIPLADLETAASKSKKQLVAFLVEKTKRSEGAVEKILASSQDVLSGKDIDMRRLLNTACDNKRDLSMRIAPFVFALRKDLHGLPVIFNAGSLVVKQTRARRDSGTEYTPRELAEEMVQFELEPLVYSPGPRDGVEPEQWKLRASKKLLDLKICDPAVGSGAFLVSACRYLADRVVEAWIAEDPQLENTNRDDLTLEARRAVVDRCLYGVDRDSMAVEMAKLSLWLITMARERPFSFLDHSIREGDSLLGVTSLDQILFAHMDPNAGRALHDGALFDVTAAVKPLVQRASMLRRQLEALPSVTVRDANEKQRLNDESDALLKTVSLVADTIVATALSTAAQAEAERNDAYRHAAMQIREALEPSQPERKRSEALAALTMWNQQRLNSARPANAPTRITLHWPLIFAEVFDGGSRFDAIVGNPPFLGGGKIGDAFGTDFRAYLVNAIAGGRRGTADLVAYFFLRAGSLARAFAFLAVNTIAQGDTKEVGLDLLVSSGWHIVRAVKSRSWPGGAGVHIAQVWCDSIDNAQRPILENVPVTAITTLLLPATRVAGYPYRLAENSGIAFKGSVIFGMGFVMEPTDAAELIRRNARNKQVLYPYVNADDVCSRADHGPSRWVINFHDWPLEQAEQYPECLSIVLERVKPERDLNKRAARRERWWRYGETAPGLYRAIKPLQRVIVMPNVSKVVLPVVCDSDMVFSHGLVVIAREDDVTFGMLTSTVHRAWARQYAGSLETRTRYAVTDCFETFPFPTKCADVGNIMQQLNSLRDSVMRESNIGLTATYNKLHNPNERGCEIQQLRKLHETLDDAVRASYGWSDLDLGYGFHETDEGFRWTICQAALTEILERLLELNHQRHAEVVALDQSGSSSNGKAKRGKKAAAPVHEQQMALY